MTSSPANNCSKTNDFLRFSRFRTRCTSLSGQIMLILHPHVILVSTIDCEIFKAIRPPYPKKTWFFIPGEDFPHPSASAEKWWVFIDLLDFRIAGPARVVRYSIHMLYRRVLSIAKVSGWFDHSTLKKPGFLIPREASPSANKSETQCFSTIFETSNPLNWLEWPDNVHITSTYYYTGECYQLRGFQRDTTTPP